MGADSPHRAAAFNNPVARQFFTLGYILHTPSPVSFFLFVHGLVAGTPRLPSLRKWPFSDCVIKHLKGLETRHSKRINKKQKKQVFCLQVRHEAWNGNQHDSSTHRKAVSIPHYSSVSVWDVSVLQSPGRACVWFFLSILFFFYPRRQ